MWHSQTWANDHLRITTTIFRSHFDFLYHKCRLTTTFNNFLSPKGGRCTHGWLYILKKWWPTQIDVPHACMRSQEDKRKAIIAYVNEEAIYWLLSLLLFFFDNANWMRGEKKANTGINIIWIFQRFWALFLTQKIVT